MRMSRWICGAAVGLGVLALSAPSALAATAPLEGSLTARVPLGLSGVSSHPVPLPDGNVQLYYSSMDGGTAVDLCSPAGSCTRQTLLRGMSDLTIVTLASGERRGYFVQFDPSTQSRALFTAVMSADGLSYTDPRPLGIASAPGEKAWGVPDSVVLPDGRVRLYWVENGTSGARAGEATVSATSTDAAGLVFVRDPGYRTTGGVVDFEVLQSTPGRWVAIASTTPGRPPQKLLLASSRDGLVWRVNREPITPASANYLDPSGFATGRNTFRIYFTTSPKSNPFDGFTIAQATLKVRR